MTDITTDPRVTINHTGTLALHFHFGDGEQMAKLVAIEASLADLTENLMTTRTELKTDFDALIKAFDDNIAAREAVLATKDAKIAELVAASALDATAKADLQAGIDDADAAAKAEIAKLAPPSVDTPVDAPVDPVVVGTI